MSSIADKIHANWNGQSMFLSQVKVSVLDRAFLFGDAVYEVIRIYSGKLFHADDHFERLKASLSALKIAGVHIAEIEKRVRETLLLSQVKEGLSYIQVTRGEALRQHRYPEKCVPNVLIWVDHFDDPYKNMRESGVSAVTHKDIRWARNDIKATSLAANCMAAQFAFEQGAQEVVFVNDKDLVTEGSHTSIFAVKDGALLVAPASPNVLPGITKKLILELARHSSIPITQTLLKKAELDSLDELFISGTPEEIIAIVSLDGKAIGDGKEGPIVRRLKEAFKALVHECISAAG